MGIAIAPRIIPSMARMNGELCRRLPKSPLALLVLEPLDVRGVDPGGGRCTKWTTFPFTSGKQNHKF